MNCTSLPFRTVGAELKSTRCASALQAFIADYVNALEPDCGIEYWSDLLPRVDETLSRISGGLACVHHPFAYAASGSNEGMRIEAGVVLRDGEMVRLASAKSFGQPEECWRLARHVSGLLECLFWFEQEPYMVHMYRALRNAYPRYTRTMPTSGFTIRTQADSLCVVHEDGSELDLWKFDSNGRDMAWFIQAYARDWSTVLRSAGATVTLEGEHANLVATTQAQGLSIWAEHSTKAAAAA